MRLDKRPYDRDYIWCLSGDIDLYTMYDRRVKDSDKPDFKTILMSQVNKASANSIIETLVPAYYGKWGQGFRLEWSGVPLKEIARALLFVMNEVEYKGTEPIRFECYRNSKDLYGLVNINAGILRISNKTTTFISIKDL